MKNLLIGAVLALLSSAAFSQTVTITATPAIASGTATPTLSWSTTPAAVSCVASGAWSGTKAAAGSQVQPAITAPSTYTLTCSWPGASNSALVTWTLPTTNTDGSAYTNPGSVKVYYATGDSALVYAPSAQSVTLGPTATSTTIQSLANGTWNFAVGVVNSDGNTSALSTPAASKVIESTAPTASASAVVNVQKQPRPPTGVSVGVAVSTP